MSDQLLQFFLADPETKDADSNEPELIWKAVLRTGEWKLRPGPGGVKLNAPLKIFRDKAPKGHISMTEIKEAFDAKAKEMVTVPQVHADGTTSDGGFVHKLAIEDVKDEKGNVTESRLWAGMEITDSALKTKITEKSIRGVSGGILFGYQRTEDAKKFNQVLSHVMVTNSPWINGTGDFTDKLPENVMASEADDLPLGELEPVVEEPPAQLSEEDGKLLTALKRVLGIETKTADSTHQPPPPTPGTERIAQPPVPLADPPVPEPTAPAKGTVVWKPEEGYQVVRGRVQKALEEWRRTLLGTKINSDLSLDYPYYHCEDISGDGSNRKALVCSGYGGEREAWVVTVKLTDDGVEIEPFKNWTPAKQEWVAASEQAAPPTPHQPPSPARPAGRSPSTSVGLSVGTRSLDGVGLREAQAARAERIALGDTIPTTPGGSMARISELIQGLGVNLSDLSPEQKQQYDAALAEERRQEESERKAREDRQSSEANTFLSELATKLGLEAPEGETDPAKGLDPAIRRYVRGVFMSDDGGPAINLSFEADGNQRTQPQQSTAVDVLKGFVSALPTDTDGRVTLSQQARRLPGDVPPPAKVEDASTTSSKDAKSKADELAAMFSEQGLEGSELFATTNGGQA